MPQGRHKVPFSAKQKKLQLQQKNEKKRQADEGGSVTSESAPRQMDDGLDKIHRLGQQPASTATRTRGKFNPNRYRLQFSKESKEELEKRKRLAYETIEMVNEDALEMDIDSVFLPGSELDMPKRPHWDYSLSRDQVDAQENRYFREYLSAIESKFANEELSYFELNLETWRQLWRVLEMSDIVLIVADARFPLLLFSPALYHHVTAELRKDVIVILNKIDLVPPSLVVAWKYYFKERFPAVCIIYFTSFPSNSQDTTDPTKRMPKIRRRGRLRMAAEGALQVYEACDCIVAGAVDMSSWRQKIASELDDAEDEEDSPRAEGPVVVNKPDGELQRYEKFKDQILTLGCIGQPNVGKSSVINALVGKKVVSVSRTPGHTKHFQTIFLTPNVRLCDCPGLVFPSKVPKPLQILAGSYPIAQLREPYSSVHYLAERIPLPRVLGLHHPEARELPRAATLDWSAFLICDEWAEKRGFKTAKAARNDTHRAANQILRLALEGRLRLCLRPPGYGRDKEKWVGHAEVSEVVKMIARKKQLEEVETAAIDFEEEEDQDEETGSDEDNSPSQVVEGGRFGAKNKFSLLSLAD